MGDEQVQRWQAESRAGGARPRTDAGRACVIAVSNSFGAGGGAIATRVGALLGIPVYDRDIVRHIAESARVSVQVVDTLDQRARGRIDDYLAAITQEKNFDQADYLRHLTRTILALAEHGPCALVGHGAVNIVDREWALTVRVVAPVADRVRAAASRMSLTLEEAEATVRQTDAERAAFHRRLFRRAVDEPLSYDLILNTSGFDVEGSAAVVAEAFRRKLEHATARGAADTGAPGTVAT
jgi:cytidylate kinase